MDKFYFSAKIQQEYAVAIREKAVEVGVPNENIIFNRQACKLLELGIYIKFENKDTYEKFKNLQLPGIVETW